jgi:hypothetical protein
MVAVGCSFVAVAQSRAAADDVGAQYQVLGGDVGPRFRAPCHFCVKSKRVAASVSGRGAGRRMVSSRSLSIADVGHPP